MDQTVQSNSSLKIMVFKLKIPLLNQLFSQLLNWFFKFWASLLTIINSAANRTPSKESAIMETVNQICLCVCKSQPIAMIVTKSLWLTLVTYNSNLLWQCLPTGCRIRWFFEFASTKTWNLMQWSVNCKMIHSESSLKCSENTLCLEFEFRSRV